MTATNRLRPPRSASAARPPAAEVEARIAELTAKIRAAAARSTPTPTPAFAGWED